MRRVKVELEDEMGGIYVLPSLVYAREYLGLSRKMLEAVLDKGIRVGGFLVRTSEAEDTNEWDLPRRKGGTERRRVRLAVVAFKAGQAVRFPTIEDAARTAGCRDVTIRQAMRREATAGGWRWVKAEEYAGEYEEWYPGMPIDFRFRLNTRIEGQPVRRKPVDESGETEEQKVWRKHGCSNNEEWHAYLKKTMEEGEFDPPLAEPNTDDYGIF